ncbi:MAG: glutathione S-transferase family protein [Pseudomonadota bacterium]
MTYVLHYAPDNASLIVRLALEEMQLPYRTVLVDRATRAQDSAAYRAINPAGLIPALETPDGTMFETAAILLWLADRHGRMAPAPDAPERADFLKHLFFASNTLHTQMRMTFYPDQYVGDDAAAQNRLRTTLQGRGAQGMTLPKALHLLDDWYGGDPRGEITVLDLYIACLLRWCAIYPKGRSGWFNLHDYPALSARAARLEAHPAVQAAQTAEGLGSAPFTAPRHPTPPEGSAT